MKSKLIIGISVLLSLCCITSVFAAGTKQPLLTTKVHLHDKASLQRGARLFMNYCSGCHSLQYLRYNRMAADLGIVDRDGKPDEALVRNNLMFDQNYKFGDLITNSMPKADAERWFGVAPPDLSVIARVRGANWLYTYLMSFYQDQTRPWGVDNLVFASVSMPDVLLELRGDQVPVYRVEKIKFNGTIKEQKVIDHLQIIKPGTMSSAQFNQSVQDLVSFLVYVGEPAKLQRYKIGLGVLLFLVVLFILMVLLKKAYWKGIK